MISVKIQEISIYEAYNSKKGLLSNILEFSRNTYYQSIVENSTYLLFRFRLIHQIRNFSVTSILNFSFVRFLIFQIYLIKTI